MFGIESTKRWWLLMAILLAAGSASAAPEGEPLRPSFGDLERPNAAKHSALDSHYTRIARLAVLASALQVGAAIDGRTDVVWLGRVRVMRGLRAVRGSADVTVERTTERTDTATGRTRTIVTRWRISPRGLEQIEIEQGLSRKNLRPQGSGASRSLGPGHRRFERVRAGLDRALRREGVVF